MRAFVSTVRGSSILSSILTEFVRNCDPSGRTFKADVETRFSSTLVMLQRFLDMENVVHKLQAEVKHHKMLQDVFFTPGDFRVIREIVEIMLPFSEAITILSSSTTITYTFAIYLTRSHFPDEEVRQIQSALQTSPEPPLKKTKLNEHLSVLKKFASNTVASSHDEVELYLNLPPIAIEEDPLRWWRNAHSFPRLRALARRSLAVFATSVFCEEVNSLAGYVVNPRRTSLASKTVKHLIFLKCNRNFIPEDYQ